MEEKHLVALLATLLASRGGITIEQAATDAYALLDAVEAEEKRRYDRKMSFLKPKPKSGPPKLTF